MALRRCNKNAIIVFHRIFDFMMNQPKKTKTKKNGAMNWMNVENMGRKDAKQVYLQRQLPKKKKIQNNDDTHVVRIRFDCVRCFSSFLYICVFILHLISPQPFALFFDRFGLILRVAANQNLSTKFQPHI